MLPREEVISTREKTGFFSRSTRREGKHASLPSSRDDITIFTPIEDVRVAMFGRYKWNLLFHPSTDMGTTASPSREADRQH